MHYHITGSGGGVSLRERIRCEDLLRLRYSKLEVHGYCMRSLTADTDTLYCLLILYIAYCNSGNMVDPD